MLSKPLIGLNFTPLTVLTRSWKVLDIGKAESNADVAGRLDALMKA